MSVATTAAMFDALGDRHRLQIVIGLCDGGARSTLQVAQSIPLSRQATTKHLELLASAGMVTSVKQGRERIWTVKPQALADAGDYLVLLSRRWDDALTRLQAFIDTDTPPGDQNRG